MVKESECRALSIQTMPVQTGARLTGDRLKALCLIIEREFSNKESLYHQIQEREKEKIIEAYRKDVGFEKLVKRLNELLVQQETIAVKVADVKEEMNKLGLDAHGNPQATTSYEYTKFGSIAHTNYKAVALHKKLKTLEDNAPSQNLKAKLLTRLQLATTIGEATVIMREVLGNGLLPSITARELSATPPVQEE